ncbi:MAG: hypothetical protein EA351_05295 [Gemmatimonadales bacterium]|nr:MAG: hypothetical protein EA351_05295 [Gemmatimonadales bacterium]
MAPSVPGSPPVSLPHCIASAFYQTNAPILLEAGRSDGTDALELQVLQCTKFRFGVDESLDR